MYECFARAFPRIYVEYILLFSVNDVKEIAGRKFFAQFALNLRLQVYAHAFTAPA